MICDVNCNYQSINHHQFSIKYNNYFFVKKGNLKNQIFHAKTLNTRTIHSINIVFKALIVKPITCLSNTEANKPKAKKPLEPTYSNSQKMPTIPKKGTINI